MEKVGTKGWCSDGSLCVAVFRTLISTLILGGAIELIATLGLLGWLETRTAAFLNTITGPPPGLFEKQQLRELPRILIIDDDSYETDFSRTSPLDRGQILRLLTPVLDQKPAVIAIDLDLAPSSTAEAERARPLYNAICRAARPDLEQPASTDCLKLAATRPAMDCRNTTRFALIEPFRASRPETQAAIESWLTEMRALEPCLYFAKAELHRHHGRAILFNPEFPNLGVVTYWLLKGFAPPQIPASAEDDAETPINTRTLHVAGWDVGIPHGLPRFIASVPGPDLSSRLSFDNPREQVVFIGGGWGNDDKHGTAIAQNVDGVVVHAAVFDSLIKPLGGTRLFGFTIDLVSGVVTGLAFGWLLARYHTSRRIAAGRIKSAALISFPTRGFWFPYGKAMLFLGLAWLLFIASIVWVFIFAMGRLEAGQWLNPAGIIFGMFVEKIIESSDSEDAKNSPTDAQQPGPLRTSLAVLGSVIWSIRTLAFAGFILYGLAAVAFDF